MNRLSHSSNVKTLYKGFVSITETPISTESGTYPYITVHTRPHSVMIIPFIDEKNCLICHEMRYSVMQKVLSFPAGLVSEDENPLQAAQRELLEETGYQAEELIFLGSCYPLPGLLAQTMHVFMGKKIKKVAEQQLDSVENISTEIVALSKLKKLFSSPKHIDGNALASFALFILKETLLLT